MKVTALRVQSSEFRVARSALRAPGAAGFTLIEILIAMFIIAIGLSAIAAVFYGALQLQRNAFRNVTAAQVAREAEHLLVGRGIDEQVLVQELDNDPAMPPSLDWDTMSFVWRAPPSMLPAADAAYPGGTLGPAQWRIADRIRPRIFFGAGSEPLPSPPFPTLIERFDQARFLWVPLVRDVNTTAGQYEWQVFVFILSADRGDYTVVPPSLLNAWQPHANPFDGSPNTNSPNDPRLLPWVVVETVTPISGPNDMPSILGGVDHNGGGGADDHLHAGDPVLLGNGVIGRVLNVHVNGDPGRIELDTPHRLSGNHLMWFAPMAQHQSPAVIILELSREVVR